MDYYSRNFFIQKKLGNQGCLIQEFIMLQTLQLIYNMFYFQNLYLGNITSTT